MAKQRKNEETTENDDKVVKTRGPRRQREFSLQVKDSEGVYQNSGLILNDRESAIRIKEWLLTGKVQDFETNELRLSETIIMG